LLKTYKSKNLLPDKQIFMLNISGKKKIPKSTVEVKIKAVKCGEEVFYNASATSHTHQSLNEIPKPAKLKIRRNENYA